MIEFLQLLFQALPKHEQAYAYLMQFYNTPEFIIEQGLLEIWIGPTSLPNDIDKVFDVWYKCNKGLPKSLGEL